MRAFIMCTTLLLSAMTYCHAEGHFNPHDRLRDGDRHLKVFDARGDVVARLASQGSGQQGVFLRANGALFFAPIEHKTIAANHYSASEFEWFATEFLVDYSTSDCSGTPLVYAESTGRPVVLLRRGPDVTAYIAGPNDSGTLTVRSYYGGDNLTHRCVDISSGGGYPSDDEWTPQMTYSLTDHYPEPLSIHY